MKIGLSAPQWRMLEAVKTTGDAGCYLRWRSKLGKAQKQSSDLWRAGAARTMEFLRRHELVNFGRNGEKDQITLRGKIALRRRRVLIAL